MTKVAVLDDWQDAARPSADWSPLEAKAEVVFFRDTLHDEDALVRRLEDFDILLTMRERTRFPASVIAREIRKALPTGRLLIFMAVVSAPAQGTPGFRAILQFPNLIEVKTSPKSWR